MKSRYIVLIAVLFLVSCQSIKHKVQARPELTPSTPSTEQPPDVSPQTFPSETQEISPGVQQVLPKIGLILGPGGARTFAHIAFLQELNRAKIPIHAIAGVEFAAPMAALFARKGLANDVEWQMMKLKSKDLEDTPLKTSRQMDFLNLVFQGVKVEDFKLPFVCPALNISKKQVFMMSRGLLSQLIPYCWPYPPVMTPFNSNVSALREIQTLVDFLRAQGANVIVYVNVLPQQMDKPLVGHSMDSTENIVWQDLAIAIQGQLSKSTKRLDQVIHISIGNYGILDFEQRRAILQKSAESSVDLVKQLAQKFNF